MFSFKLNKKFIVLNNRNGSRKPKTLKMSCCAGRRFDFKFVHLVVTHKSWSLTPFLYWYTSTTENLVQLSVCCLDLDTQVFEFMKFEFMKNLYFDYFLKILQNLTGIHLFRSDYLGLACGSGVLALPSSSPFSLTVRVLQQFTSSGHPTLCSGFHVFIRLTWQKL